MAPEFLYTFLYKLSNYPTPRFFSDLGYAASGRFCAGSLGTFGGNFFRPNAQRRARETLI